MGLNMCQTSVNIIMNFSHILPG